MHVADLEKLMLFYTTHLVELERVFFLLGIW